MGPSFRGPPTIPRSGSRRDLVTIVPSGIIIIPTNPSSKNFINEVMEVAEMMRVMVKEVIEIALINKVMEVWI